MDIKELGNIPFDLSVLSSVFPKLASISNKAMELEKTGQIIRLKKGLYVVSPSVSGTLLSDSLIANHIYGPSYISMETALRHFGMIPERVRAVRSMTTKHTRTFENAVGRYEYIGCSKNVFPIGIQMMAEGGISYLIASPEKALYDILMSQTTTDLRFNHVLRIYLEDNLRLDMEAFHRLDREVLIACSEAGKKKELIDNLLKLI
jgi:hypothetical protein